MGQQLVTEKGDGDVDHYVSPAGMIRHFSGKAYVHPDGGSANPANYTKLITHVEFHANVHFRFVQVQGHWGYIEHVSSGKFFHPKGGERNPDSGTNIILHNGCHGGCLFTYDEDSHVIQHRGGLYIHPKGGSTNPENYVILILHGGVHDGMRWFPVSVDDIPAEIFPTPEVTGRWLPVKIKRNDETDKTTSKLRISVGRKKTMCNTFRHDWMISSVALDRISSFVANNETYKQLLAETTQSAFEDCREVNVECGSELITWQWVWSVCQMGDGWDFKTNVVTYTDSSSNVPSLNRLPVLLSL